MNNLYTIEDRMSKSVDFMTYILLPVFTFVFCVPVLFWAGGYWDLTNKEIKEGVEECQSYQLDYKVVNNGWTNQPRKITCLPKKN